MLMKRPQVEQFTSLSRSGIYALMAKGEFPRPIKLGIRAVAWRCADIEAWLGSRETSVGGLSHD